MDKTFVETYRKESPMSEAVLLILKEIARGYREFKGKEVILAFNTTTDFWEVKKDDQTLFSNKYTSPAVRKFVEEEGEKAIAERFSK